MKMIAAVGRNYEIGRGNELPWRCPSELKLFRELTTNATVVMGRKTMESLKRPLPERHNVVLTRSSGFMPNGFYPATMDDVMQLDGPVWVIGGAQIYSLFLPHVDSDDSRIKQRIAEAGQCFGETLLRDDALRESLNEHLEQAAHRVAPEFAAFLTRHISDTVKSWDARDMSRQIELNIGKDLQFIRINGTLVGGTIGLLLWLLSQIPSLLHLHIG